MESDLNYKEDLKIDKDNLDIELAKIPELYSKWSEKLIKEENRKERIKDRIELKFAELDIKIRSNPEVFGLEESPTERTIRSTILKNEKYRQLQKEYLKAKLNVGILKIAVRDIKNKEKAIERLVKLWLTNYYAETSDNHSEELRRSLNTSMKVRKFLRK